MVAVDRPHDAGPRPLDHQIAAFVGSAFRSVLAEDGGFDAEKGQGRRAGFGRNSAWKG
ncbi:hypothetical protein D3C83_129500 [compost metagenome]